MISNIQVLRCIAALLVVWHHVQGPLNGYLGAGLDTGFGAAGVDIFFVISGFIMFHTNADFPRTTGRFWLDRIIRIAPLYWIATWLIIVMAWVGLKPILLDRFDAGDIFAAMAFIPDVRADGSLMPILSPGWTLNFEMFFYFLFGLTFFLRSQMTSLIVLTVAFLGFWLVSLIAPLPFAANAFAQPITLEFAAGAGLALLNRRWRAGPSSIASGYGLIAGGVIGLFAADIFAHEFLYSEGIVRTACFGAPAIAIVAGALLLEKAGHVCRSRTMMLLGSASYASYLFHLPVIQASAKATISVLKFGGAPMIAIVATLVLLASAAFGVAVHLFIEKPLQAFLKTHTRNWFRRTSRRAGLTGPVAAE